MALPLTPSAQIQDAQLTPTSKFSSPSSCIPKVSPQPEGLSWPGAVSQQQGTNPQVISDTNSLKPLRSPSAAPNTGHSSPAAPGTRDTALVSPHSPSGVTSGPSCPFPHREDDYLLQSGSHTRTPRSISPQRFGQSFRRIYKLWRTLPFSVKLYKHEPSLLTASCPCQPHPEPIISFFPGTASFSKPARQQRSRRPRPGPPHAGQPQGDPASPKTGPEGGRAGENGRERVRRGRVLAG